MQTFFSYGVVFLGAGLGGMFRHAANRAGVMLGFTFPWSTLFVNATGCLVMGLFAGWFTFRGEEAGQTLRLFLTTGILGGYTTFSAFSLDTALLYERGHIELAILYVSASIGAALLGGLCRSLPHAPSSVKEVSHMNASCQGKNKRGSAEENLLSLIIQILHARSAAAVFLTERGR